MQHVAEAQVPSLPGPAVDATLPGKAKAAPSALCGGARRREPTLLVRNLSDLETKVVCDSRLKILAKRRGLSLRSDQYLK